MTYSAQRASLVTWFVSGSWPHSIGGIGAGFVNMGWARLPGWVGSIGVKRQSQAVKDPGRSLGSVVKFWLGRGLGHLSSNAFDYGRGVGPGDAVIFRRNSGQG